MQLQPMGAYGASNPHSPIMPPIPYGVGLASSQPVVLPQLPAPASSSSWVPSLSLPASTQYRGGVTTATPTGWSHPKPKPCKRCGSSRDARTATLIRGDLQPAHHRPQSYHTQAPALPGHLHRNAYAEPPPPLPSNSHTDHRYDYPGAWTKHDPPHTEGLSSVAPDNAAAHPQSRPHGGNLAAQAPSAQGRDLVVWLPVQA